MKIIFWPAVCLSYFSIQHHAIICMWLPKLDSHRLFQKNLELKYFLVRLQSHFSTNEYFTYSDNMIHPSKIFSLLFQFTFLWGETISESKSGANTSNLPCIRLFEEIKYFDVVSANCNEQHVLPTKQTYLQKEETHKLLGGKMNIISCLQFQGGFLK